MGAIVFPETLISNSKNPRIGLASHWGKLLLLKRRVILMDGHMPTTWLVTQEGGEATIRNLLSGPTTGHTSDKERSKKPQIKMGTINIGTIRHKEEELMEVMMERGLNILGLCETRLDGHGQRTLHNNYVLIYSGGANRRHEVGIMLSPELADRVDSTNFKSERVLNITLKLKSRNISIIQIYAPQQGRPNNEKGAFYDELQSAVDMSQYRENLIIIGDWNGHVGTDRLGVENIIGSFGVGERNAEGRRILDFCLSQNLAVMNTFFKHRDSHKWTWYRYDSGRQRYMGHSMIDLVAANSKKMFRDLVSVDSDHQLIVAKIDEGPPRK